MIPKKIHYIWLGGRPLSNLSNICINSWRENVPEYEIIEWNEKNLDLDKIASENRFFKECRKRKLYAYMADYLRLRILYEQGGIYMDTDIQVIKSFDTLTDTAFLIGKAPHNKIGTGFIGAEPKSPIIKMLLDFYESDIWTHHLFIIPDIVEYVFKKNKVQINIYNEEYFSPCAFDKPFDRSEITENTRTIHWYEGTWKKNKQVAVFLETKDISNPIFRKMMMAKKWLGYYLHKFKILR